MILVASSICGIDVNLFLLSDHVIKCGSPSTIIASYKLLVPLAEYL